MSQLFTWGGQSIGISASASVLLMNIQDWFSLGWTGWISLQSKGLSRIFSNTTVQKQFNAYNWNKPKNGSSAKCLVTFATVGLGVFLIALFNHINFFIIDIIIGLCFYFIIPQNSSMIGLSCSLLTTLCRFLFWKASEDNADVLSVKLSQWWKTPWRAQSGAALS